MSKACPKYKEVVNAKGQEKNERIGSNVINIPPSSANSQNGSYGGMVK